MRNLVACLVLLFATSAMLLSATSAIAGNNAGYEMGGRYGRFDPVVAQYNRSGELFRIEGHCQSSCTLFLAIRNVCIDPGATLLFHSARDPGTANVSPRLTTHMLAAYNGRLRSYVTANHYMDTLEFHSISGGDMIQKFGYRACPKA
jgi:hypothetical protein